MPIGSLIYLDNNIDLGPLRILNQKTTGQLMVRAIWSGDKHVVNKKEAGARLFPLFPGQRVALESDPEKVGVIRCVDDPQSSKLRSLTLKLPDTDLVTQESKVVPAVPQLQDPIQVFEALTYRGAGPFQGRWNLRREVSRWYEETEGVPGLLGARVRLLGHQLYACRRVLWSTSPRFILADEVGLGKTVEAGLILQTLWASRPELSVLVIAPGTMTRQWLCELYLRFGGRAFNLVDLPRLRTISAAEKLRLSYSTRMVLSSDVLGNDSILQKAVLRRKWGMVVIDEAHQYPPGHALFRLLLEISRNSEGLLALSATPSKREVKGLLGLLQLTSPENYEGLNEADLEARIKDKQEIWDKLLFTTKLQSEARYEGTSLDADALEMIAEEWDGLLDADPMVSEFRERVRQGDAAAVDELVGYVQEFHRIDHRIVRTRRATLSSFEAGWSQRIPEKIAYQPKATEVLVAEHVERLAQYSLSEPNALALCGLYHRASCTTPDHFDSILQRRVRSLNRGVPSTPKGYLETWMSDPGAEDEEWLLGAILEGVPAFPKERQWLEQARGLVSDWQAAEEGGCGRFQAATNWIAQHLEKSPARKVLVFSQERQVVEAFSLHLQALLGKPSVEVFHFALDSHQLNDAALRFQRDPQCRILVSDELGGEGRNFQMATAVVHLDQPWSVARLEQRIGRLDRMGRPAEVPVLTVSLVGPNRLEQAVVTLQHEVFNVHSRSIGGLEFILPALQREIHQSACKGSHTFRGHRDRWQALVREGLQQTDLDFERSNDSSKRELLLSTELAQVLEAEVGGAVAGPLTYWAKHLKVYSHRDGKIVDFSWEREYLRHALIGFRNRGTGKMDFRGTFHRRLALEDESLHLFAPGHLLVDALVESLDSSSQGRAAAFYRDLGPENAGRAFLLVMGRTMLDEEQWPSHEEMPAGLKARACRRLFPAVEMATVALDPGGDFPATAVTDSALSRRLLAGHAGNIPEPVCRINELYSLFKLDQLFAAMREGVVSGLAQIRAARRDVVELAAQGLQEDFRYDFGYLRGLLRIPGQRAQAGTELRLREALIESVRSERVEVEAILLIVGKR